MSEAGAVRVLPDGFVAWRSATAVSDLLEQLRHVMRRVLHRAA